MRSCSIETRGVGDLGHRIRGGTRDEARRDQRDLRQGVATSSLTPASPAERLLSLQHAVGNRAVSRLLSERAKSGSSTQPARSSRSTLAVQRNGSARLLRGRVVTRWSDDSAAFYRRLVEAVAAAGAFSEVPEGALWQPFHDPVHAYHRTLAEDLSRRAGSRVSIEVQFFHDPSGIPRVRSVSLGPRPVSPQSETRTPPPTQASPAGWAGVLTTYLDGATRQAARAAIVVRSGAGEVASWEAFGGPAPRPTSSSSTVAQVFRLLQSGTPALASAYDVEFRRDGRSWSAIRIRHVMTLRETPAPPPSGTPQRRSRPVPNEAEAVISDVRANRELVLSTAAMAIAQQDPTRLENIVMAVGPFAIARLGRLRGLARVRALAALRRLRLRPRFFNRWSRGRYHAARPVDPQLLEAAKMRRASEGVRPADFDLNVASAKVEIDGRITYIDHANTPGALHSEEHIIRLLQDHKNAGRRVRMHQLYTERHPCAGCRNLLDTLFPDADVFWSVRQGRQSNRDLQRAWGLLD